MSQELTVLFVLVVGMQLAVQAPLNSGLGRTVGMLPAALVSFLVGLAALLVICLFAGTLGDLRSIGDAGLTGVMGGLIGATYVATSTVTISRIGAGAVAAATIAGQLSCSLLIDDFGWVGVETIPVTGLRIFGALLLLGGTVLVVFRRRSGFAGEGARRSTAIAVVAVVAAGALVGLQHPLNAELAENVGGLNSALVNFVTGTVLLAAVVLAAGLGGRLRDIGEVRWFYLLGGLIGLITVLSALTAVGEIGAAGLTAAIVTGQLLSSVALDRFGAFGLERRKVTLARISGVALLLAGTMLTVG